MIRIFPLSCSAGLATLLFAGGLPAVAQSTSPSEGTPVFESTSSGLITFSGEDEAIRVAVVFAKQDDAVVATVVNFVDANGTVLKQQRGDLRHGRPIVAELTQSDVGEQTDLLVRVKVIHKLPGERDGGYPILVTVQPLARGGFGRFVMNWDAGRCGCPCCGPPLKDGVHADCSGTLPETL
jgi:hypothetical protein